MSNNAHLKRYCKPTDLVLVVGNMEKSKLLNMAILISQRKFDKEGRPYHVVSDKMERSLGISGAIQRSIPPRFIKRVRNIEHLKSICRIPKKEIE